jgi:uncharacterized membrane protein (DUF485 family)
MYTSTKKVSPGISAFRPQSPVRTLIAALIPCPQILMVVVLEDRHSLTCGNMFGLRVRDRTEGRLALTVIISLRAWLYTIVVGHKSPLFGVSCCISFFVMFMLFFVYGFQSGTMNVRVRPHLLHRSIPLKYRQQKIVMHRILTDISMKSPKTAFTLLDIWLLCSKSQLIQLNLYTRPISRFRISQVIR